MFDSFEGTDVPAALEDENPSPHRADENAPVAHRAPRDRHTSHGPLLPHAHVPLPSLHTAHGHLTRIVSGVVGIRPDFETHMCPQVRNTMTRRLVGTQMR